MRSVESGDLGASEQADKPKIKMSAAEFSLLQEVAPNDKKWASAPVLEVNGVPVDAGIIDIEVDGEKIKIDTDKSRFGQIV